MISPKIAQFSFLILFLSFLTSCSSNKHLAERVVYNDNKIIPVEILEEAKVALSFFPELKDVRIEFKYKDNIDDSFMQAQPDFSDALRRKSKRSYNIYISDRFLIKDDKVSLEDVPSDVLIGWLAHELGHVMDYRDRTAMGMVIFGLNYITSDKFLVEAERMADVYAVNNGMSEYILATKNFILNHAGFTDEYKRKIATLYLSPDEILALVDELDAAEEEEEENSES